MSGCDVKCEGVEQADGTWTLELSISGLTQAQAQEIADGLRLRVREITLAAINKDGRKMMIESSP